MQLLQTARPITGRRRPETASRQTQVRAPTDSAPVNEEGRVMDADSAPVRILGVAGSLRRDSYNRKLLRAAAELSPPGVEFLTWDRLKTIPPFDEDDEETPAETVLELRRAIAEADALLIATPEYNGSLPGQLKNALDWASRPRRATVLHEKPAAVIGASPSPSGSRSAQADARRVLARAGARVIDRELAVARAFERFDAGGRLVDDELRSGLSDLWAEIAPAIRSRALSAA